VEWRDAAKKRLKEIGEAIAADVDSVLDDLKIQDAAPAVIDLATTEEPEAPSPTS
jgi:hypothetical protein